MPPRPPAAWRPARHVGCGVLLLALLALLFGGCAVLAARDPPRVSVVGVEPLASEGLEIRLAVKLRIQNPNDAAIDYDGIALDLEVNGRPLASGLSDARGTVPRFGRGGAERAGHDLGARRRAPGARPDRRPAARAAALRAARQAGRQELGRGSVEELRQRVADFQSGLTLRRTLVPSDNEVAQLINDISDRAKLRSVYVADLSPLGTEAGGQYQVTRYRFQVLGHYDDIGAFLSDIASLRRIMVPHSLSLTLATDAQSEVVGDTTGALLVGSFQLKAYVKQPPIAGEGGTGGDR